MFPTVVLLNLFLFAQLAVVTGLGLVSKNVTMGWGDRVMDAATSVRLSVDTTAPQILPVSDQTMFAFTLVATVSKPTLKGAMIPI